MIFDFNKVCLTSNQWVNNFRKGIIEYLGEEQVTKDAEEFYKNIHKTLTCVYKNVNI